MELWIRSQDKLRLAKIENVIINYNRQTEIIGNYYSADDIEKEIPLGEYTTKERALEVLDEIQEVLCPKVLIMKPKSQITISDNVNLVLPDNCSYERIGDTYVYEMPEE
jgi:hypothetical protein